eukprot:scaffold295395_cov55-Attheya_sp.AAC.2
MNSLLSLECWLVSCTAIHDSTIDNDCSPTESYVLVTKDSNIGVSVDAHLVPVINVKNKPDRR